MALKTFKARSQGMRFRVASTFEEITEKKPVKSLTRAKRKTAGRNNQGRITTRHRGGGAKRRIRIQSFLHRSNQFFANAAANRLKIIRKILLYCG